MRARGLEHRLNIIEHFYEYELAKRLTFDSERVGSIVRGKIFCEKVQI